MERDGNRQGCSSEAECVNTLGETLAVGVGGAFAGIPRLADGGTTGMVGWINPLVRVCV